MDQQTYTITFDDISEGDADRYAGELRNFLLDAAPDIEVEPTNCATRLLKR